jgi:hypothetical protein
MMAAGGRRRARRGTPQRRRWSARVTRESRALVLEPGVFTKRSPRAIARSLKRSAERSRRRKSSPSRSAMSMLTFYENRAGRQLTPAQRARLARAKEELRAAFGRREGRRSRQGPRARGRRAPVRRARRAARARS